MLHSPAAGFLTGLSLIVAIGAQNAYVLRQGILRVHVAPVVAVCALSDVALISVGVSGVGAVVTRADALLDVVRWGGVAFLLWYAAGALRRATQPEALGTAAGPDGHGSRRHVVGRAMALTWLNPHVYLDTVLLVGSIAATHDGAPGGRWWFAAGAGVASVFWFVGLGFGARLAAPLLARPRAWQILELCIAATMAFVATRLILSS